MPSVAEHAPEYLLASALSAALNYPLWRASAVGQSGFFVTAVGTPPSSLSPVLAPFVQAFSPPYKGMGATIAGMTWARAAIFYGSDRGREILRECDIDLPPWAQIIIPPFVVSVLVQIVNMPVVRASITIQNPASDIPDIRGAFRHIYRRGGIGALYHGTSAGILKTVPKYCTAVLVKDWMDGKLTEPDRGSRTYRQDCLWRSAKKSVVAGVAGAVLTNPLDVIRNEMFKTDKGLLSTVSGLYRDLGWRFAVRGIGQNMVAVAVPVGSTIFFTDAFIQFRSN